MLVVCPAAICLQWRDELWRRFGLHFEIVHRDFVARRRQERGFGINPWATHTRFIISHAPGHWAGGGEDRAKQPSSLPAVSYPVILSATTPEI